MQGNSLLQNSQESVKGRHRSVINKGQYYSYSKKELRDNYQTEEQQHSSLANIDVKPLSMSMKKEELRGSKTGKLPRLMQIKKGEAASVQARIQAKNKAMSSIVSTSIQKTSMPTVESASENRDGSP